MVEGERKEGTKYWRGGSRCCIMGFLWGGGREEKTYPPRPTPFCHIAVDSVKGGREIKAQKALAFAAFFMYFSWPPFAGSIFGEVAAVCVFALRVRPRSGN